MQHLGLNLGPGSGIRRAVRLCWLWGGGDGGAAAEVSVAEGVGRPAMAAAGTATLSVGGGVGVLPVELLRGFRSLKNNKTKRYRQKWFHTL